MARKDIIMLSHEELKRLHIIQKVLEGALRQVEAFEMAGIQISDETLRLWLILEREWQKQRKGRAHHQWREQRNSQRAQS